MDNPSQVITLFCWILDASDSSFAVDIDSSRTVDHLRKEIKLQNPSALANINIDAPQLKLWQPEVSIQITRDLKNEISKHQFLNENRLLESRRLSSYFINPAEETLHVVVRVTPSAATISPSNSDDSKLSDRPAGTTISPSSSDNSKFAAVANDMNSEERHLRLLCERYWGRGEEGWAEILRHEKIVVPQPVGDDTVVDEPAPSTISVPVSSHLNHAHGTETKIQTVDSTHEAPEVSYDSIYLGPDFKNFFATQSDSMLVREEYRQMVKHLEGLDVDDNRGAVVTGQLGIGKSTFLYYVLIYRVLKAKETAFQWSSRRTFLLLGRHDVRVYDPQRQIDPLGFPGVWALTDSNADLVTPRDEFVDTHSKFFLVQAAPPQPHRWKSWVKQLSGTLAVMGPWTWEEIYIVGTQFRTPRIEDVRTLWDVFSKYGGAARHCYKLARHPSSRESWANVIPHLLQSLPALRDVQSADATNEILLKTSSQIITIVPNNDRSPTIAFVSQYMTDLYFELVLKNNAEKFWENFNLFWSVKQSHNSAGWMWEGWVISRELRDGPARDIELRRLGRLGDNDVDSAPPKKKQRTIPNLLRLPFTHTATHADVKSLAGEISSLLPSITDADILFVPGRRNQVTFDAFSISADGCVTLFQPTVQGLYSIKASGLDFIWDAIRIAQEKIPTAQDLLPNKTNKWRIVFIVPNRVEAEWKYSRSIDIEGIQPKRQWTDYIEQFVVGFRDTLPDKVVPGPSHQRKVTGWRGTTTKPHPSHSPPSTSFGNFSRRSPRLRKEKPEAILRSQ